MSQAFDITQTPTEIVKADALAPAFVGLEASSARQLREAFVPALLQIEEWEVQARGLTVTDETQTAKMKMAGVMRRELKKVRVGVEKRRKELNADALARTKAINGAAGIVEALIVPLEKHLGEQESYGERAEEARRTALHGARAETLRALGTDPANYAPLGALDDATWASILEGAQAAHDAKILATKEAEEIRVQAEKIAAERRRAEKEAAAKIEAERVAEAARVAEENARLREEARVLQEAALAERTRIEIERAAERAAAKAEADAKNEAFRAEQAERDRVARQEREAAEKVRREEAAKHEAAEVEARRVAAELAAEKAATAKAAREREEAEAARVAKEAADREARELAPDKEKLAGMAAILRSLVVPTCATDKGQAAAKRIQEQIEKLAAWTDKTAAALS